MTREFIVDTPMAEFRVKEDKTLHQIPNTDMAMVDTIFTVTSKYFPKLIITNRDLNVAIRQAMEEFDRLSPIIDVEIISISIEPLPTVTPKKAKKEKIKKPLAKNTVDNVQVSK